MCFQCAATVALNHEEIGRNPQKNIKINPFINKYNWKKINYLTGKDDWKKFEKINPIIFLNVFYVKKMNIHPAYISKHNRIMKNKQLF